MEIRIALRGWISRIALLGVAILAFGLLVRITLDHFVIFAMSDYRALIELPMIKAANEFRPNSPRLLAKLAEVEISDPESDAESAEQHALQAIKYSPNDYNNWLLLGRIRDARGDTVGAAEAIGEALRLAPNDHISHWRMANILLRDGKLEESLPHFHFVTRFNEPVLPVTLDMVWQTSGGRIPALNRIVGERPHALITLALFLAKKSQMADAAVTFAKVDPVVWNKSPYAQQFFETLVTKGHPKLASDLWLRMKQANAAGSDQPFIWNGDFENEPVKNLLQFEWVIVKTDYARIGVDKGRAHTGNGALMIDFLARDTTRLENEIRHLIVVRPGAKYELSFFVKTDNFQPPAGNPGVVAALTTTDQAATWIAQSDPVPPGTNDWAQISFTFTAPGAAGDGAPLYVSIKRKPALSYDEPTRGRIWLDDFLIREVRGK